MFWIIFGVITTVVIIGFMIKNLPLIYEMKDISDTPFVCSNCGKNFYIKWYRFTFNLPRYYTYHSIKCKCPHCKKVDMCKHSDNEAV